MEDNVTYGACRFCGQINTNSHVGYKTQEQANECATLSCNCYDAREYTEQLQAKKKAEEDRQQAIKRAGEQIEDLFGSGVVEYRLQPVETNIKELMLNSAIMIYDSLLKDISINITSWIKVKISKSAKGKLTFMRSDAAVFKQEV